MSTTAFLQLSSPARALRSFPTLLAVGFADALAYRLEFFVWLLTTNMPLVMLALWSSVAEEAPIGRFGSTQFTAYYLATLIVRLLTGCWVAWEMNMEIRQGTLSMRLLRPIHPLIAYAAENIAAMPMRVVAVSPIVLVLLLGSGAGEVTREPGRLLLFVATTLLGWLLTFFLLTCIGCLGLLMDSAMSVAELYFGLFGVLSGYLIPLELFPDWLRGATSWLPFRYQLGFPVEVLVGHLSDAELLRELAMQLGWIAFFGLLGTWMWNLGMKRFHAVGG